MWRESVWQIVSPLTGWLGVHSVLESQPVGDDSHVSLSHGTHLLHVVGNLDPPGGAVDPCAPAPANTLLHWPRSAHTYPQPHMDPQEDNAASESCGLELWQQGDPTERHHRRSASGFWKTSCQLRSIISVISCFDYGFLFYYLRLSGSWLFMDACFKFYVC